MKSKIFSLLAVLVFFFFAQSSFACTGNFKPAKLSDTLSQNGVVFIGKITDFKKSGSSAETLNSANVELVETVKGDAPKNITLQSSGFSCDTFDLYDESVGDYVVIVAPKNVPSKIGPLTVESPTFVYGYKSKKLAQLISQLILTENKEFLDSNNLIIDGKKYNSYYYPISTYTLARGQKGEDIRVLQDALRYVEQRENLDVDGVFGKTTEVWVKKLQKEKNLKQDGIIGPKTAAALRDLFLFEN